MTEENAGNPERAMTARAVDEIFVRSMNTGDLATIMALYDPHAVYVQEPGKPLLKGLPNLRAAVETHLETKPKLTVELKQLVETDGIAFFSVAWELEGTTPDGEPFHLSAFDANVLRRQADGTWRTLIENPFHSQHLGLTG